MINAVVQRITYNVQRTTYNVTPLWQHRTARKFKVVQQ